MEISGNASRYIISYLGVEYSFGEGSGITQGIPKAVDGATFRESILIGITDLSSMEITKRIDALRDQFRGDQYHIILKCE